MQKSRFKVNTIADIQRVEAAVFFCFLVFFNVGLQRVK